MEACFNGEFGEVETRAQELMENMRYVSGVEFYSVPYESIRKRLDTKDFHSSDFLKDVYKLGKILGAELPDRRKTGSYIGKKQVESYPKLERRVDGKL